MKNIMLMFLSSGTKPEAKYKINKLTDTVTTKHSNESAVIELFHSLGKTPIDKIFVYASRDALKVDKYGDKNQNTLEFFRDRIKDYVEPENIVKCEFDEDKDMEEALDDISRMTGMILEYIKSVDDNDITLHADMTGGMRNASMMMIGIMRLMEYSDIKLGQILYSNWKRADIREKEHKMNYVEDSRSVYRFYDLVAGAKEFINYGSVGELEKYFEDENKSTKLQELLDAMHVFSESIKLCRRGIFHDAIERLNDAIKAFKSQEKNNINDRLFETILYSIEESYDMLFNRTDDLAIIQWCLKRGYLQQAMTLYTEYVPEYVAEKKLFYLSEAGIKKVQGDDDLNTDNYNMMVKIGRDNRSAKFSDSAQLLEEKIRNYLKIKGTTKEEKLDEIIEFQRKINEKLNNEIENKIREEIIKNTQYANAEGEIKNCIFISDTKAIEYVKLNFNEKKLKKILSETEDVYLYNNEIELTKLDYSDGTSGVGSLLVEYVECLDKTLKDLEVARDNEIKNKFMQWMSSDNNKGVLKVIDAYKVSKRNNHIIDSNRDEAILNAIKEYFRPKKSPKYLGINADVIEYLKSEPFDNKNINNYMNKMFNDLTAGEEKKSKSILEKILKAITQLDPQKKFFEVDIYMSNLYNAYMQGEKTFSAVKDGLIVDNLKNCPNVSLKQIERMYTFIRLERNSANHAREDAATMKADGLKTIITAGIDELQKAERYVKESSMTE